MARRRRNTIQQQLVHALPNEYLECRVWRHAWSLLETRRADRSMYRGAIVQKLECTRCGSTREDFFTVNGGAKKFYSRYSLAEGYLMKGVEDRPKTGDYWFEALARVEMVDA